VLSAPINSFGPLMGAERSNRKKGGGRRRGDPLITVAEGLGKGEGGEKGVMVLLVQPSAYWTVELHYVDDRRYLTGNTLAREGGEKKRGRAGYYGLPIRSSLFRRCALRSVERKRETRLPVVRSRDVFYAPPATSPRKSKKGRSGTAGAGLSSSPRKVSKGPGHLFRDDHAGVCRSCCMEGEEDAKGKRREEGKERQADGT